MHKLALSATLALALVVPALAQDAGTATATFMDAQGVEMGTLTLTQGDGTVSLSGELTGLTPGDHGLHFHTTGNCDGSTAFESAGGHFNPTDHQHGMENPEGPHAGDLPNITADEAGIATVELTTDMIAMTEGEEAYVFDADGTAIVVHAGPDDYQTDPAGNSGDRVGCAVIEAAPAA